MRILFRFVVGCMVSLPLLLAQATAREVRFASAGGVDLYSVAVPTGSANFVAVRVEARTQDPQAVITSLHEISFSGPVQQVWTGGGLGAPTVFGPGGPSELYPNAWNAFDSHLLIDESMILGGVYEAIETNDGSIDLSGLDLPNALPADVEPLGGVGDLSIGPLGAFLLTPEARSNTIEIARIVRPVWQPQFGFSYDTEMTVGFLGAGIVDSGAGGGASFGVFGLDPVAVPFLPEPRSSFLGLMAILGGLNLRRRS